MNATPEFKRDLIRMLLNEVLCDLEQNILSYDFSEMMLRFYDAISLKFIEMFEQAGKKLSLTVSLGEEEIAVRYRIRRDRIDLEIPRNLISKGEGKVIFGVVCRDYVRCFQVLFEHLLARVYVAFFEKSKSESKVMDFAEKHFGHTCLEHEVPVELPQYLQTRARVSDYVRARIGKGSTISVQGVLEGLRVVSTRGPKNFKAEFVNPHDEKRVEETTVPYWLVKSIEGVEVPHYREVHNPERRRA